MILQISQILCTNILEYFEIRCLLGIHLINNLNWLLCLFVCLTAEMSRTRAPRKTGFFAAGRSWRNLNNRKKLNFFEVRKALKIVK